jgi:hypothetical protein
MIPRFGAHDRGFSIAAFGGSREGYIPPEQTGTRNNGFHAHTRPPGV